MKPVQASLTLCRTNGTQSSFDTQQEVAAFQDVHEGVTAQQAFAVEEEVFQRTVQLMQSCAGRYEPGPEPLQNHNHAWHGRVRGDACYVKRVPSYSQRAHRVAKLHVPSNGRGTPMHVRPG